MKLTAVYLISKNTRLYLICSSNDRDKLCLQDTQEPPARQLLALGSESIRMPQLYVGEGGGKSAFRMHPVLRLSAGRNPTRPANHRNNLTFTHHCPFSNSL